jgi:hypothetical protein
MESCFHKEMVDCYWKNAATEIGCHQGRDGVDPGNA